MNERERRRGKQRAEGKQREEVETWKQKWRKMEKKKDGKEKGNLSPGKYKESQGITTEM